MEAEHDKTDLTFCRTTILLQLPIMGQHCQHKSCTKDTHAIALYVVAFYPNLEQKALNSENRFYWHV